MTAPTPPAPAPTPRRDGRTHARQASHGVLAPDSAFHERIEARRLRRYRREGNLHRQRQREETWAVLHALDRTEACRALLRYGRSRIAHPPPSLMLTDERGCSCGTEACHAAAGLDSHQLRTG